ncbi:hypothetical protein [Variovorax boronicumulans]|uniref:hypothetical protein n=1 Tax=Variovorax boronicumulans TaxID=436515 RepID=UPI0012FDCD2E|nr:hypothetical protein [Variovorax boronicumulans]
MIQLALEPRRRRPAPLPPTGPVSSLLDPRFKYQRACETDIRKTFQRVIAEQKKGQRL